MLGGIGMNNKAEYTRKRLWISVTCQEKTGWNTAKKESAAVM